MYIKNRILPVPQKFKIHVGEGVVLGKPGLAMFEIRKGSLQEDPLVESAVALISEHLSDILNVNVKSADGGVPIHIDICEAPSNLKNSEQGYSLDVNENGVYLKGFGPLGLYYGAVTLKQCLVIQENVLKLPYMSVLDWPDFKTRGHMMESRYGSNLMTIEDWKDLIDHMANMKMNRLAVSIYGCWCVQYDNRVSEYLYVPIKKYPKLKTPVVTKYFSPSKGKWINNENLPPMFEKDFFGDLIRYGKTKGITVFPLVNSYGHNTLIPTQYPEVSSKDETGEPTLTGFCTSNPKTYEMMFSIYDEIIDKYLLPNGIDSFHVGLDEVRKEIASNAGDIFKIRSPWCKCEKCNTMTKNNLFINHAVKLIKHLKERGMKNIYMYHDMLLKKENNLENDRAEDMFKALKENDLLDVAVIDWWTYSDFKENLMFQTTRPDLGIRRTVKPWNGYYHWSILTNPLKNIKLLADMGHDEGVEGMQSYSAWDKSYDRNHVCQADYSWNHKGSESNVKVTEHYVNLNFATQWDKAMKGFALMDLITEDRKGKFEDGSSVVSNYRLLLSKLSYYSYSYVRTGKPYPRIFPGEALSEVAADLEGNKRALLEIQSMAHKAKELFEYISKDSNCNMEMATRYAYEANNYLTLSEDYLALLKMMEHSKSKCPYRYDKIKKLAQERKLKRLSLMMQLESIKEDFLMASHMRNHSIFMQFFADLEGYLANTNSSEVKLDFFDMRYLESEAFKMLR